MVTAKIRIPKYYQEEYVLRGAGYQIDVSWGVFTWWFASSCRPFEFPRCTQSQTSKQFAWELCCTSVDPHRQSPFDSSQCLELIFTIEVSMYFSWSHIQTCTKLRKPCKHLTCEKKVVVFNRIILSQIIASSQMPTQILQTVDLQVMSSTMFENWNHISDTVHNHNKKWVCWVAFWDIPVAFALGNEIMRKIQTKIPSTLNLEANPRHLEHTTNTSSILTSVNKLTETVVQTMNIWAQSPKKSTSGFLETFGWNFIAHAMKIFNGILLRQYLERPGYPCPPPSGQGKEFLAFSSRAILWWQKPLSYDSKYINWLELA